MPYATVCPQLVSQLLKDYPATREELSAIRDPHQPSRFQSVYSHRHGGVNRGESRYTVKAYRARVFKFWELGCGFESPEAAARSVVAFYKANFGNNWQGAFRHRKAVPWRLRTNTKGIAADIYVRGRLVGITRADAGEGRVSEWLWASPEDAKRAVREAMRRRFEKERRSLPIPAMGLVFWRS